MSKKSLALAILISTIHLVICLLAGKFGWYNQFIIVIAFSVITMITGFRFLTIPGFFSLLLVTPFYIIYTFFSIYLKSFQTFPIWIAGIVVSFLTIFFLIKRINKTASILIIILLILLGRFYAMPYNLNRLLIIKNRELFSYFSKVVLVDSNSTKVAFDLYLGKVVLLDIWHSACLPCIKKFPELQKLSDFYKNDSSVKIISLNIPIKKDNNAKPLNLVRKYSFDKLFFQNENDAINITSVPLILIFDKQQNCAFAGGLNTGWDDIIDNPYKIINKLKIK